MFKHDNIMNNSIVASRLEQLREVMRRERLAAFIFPSTDPHGSEYVPERWKGREWISGFDGSAGTAVVTSDAAALWTDSRYFLAAEQQLAATEFALMKERIEGTPSVAQWIARKLADSDITEIGIDGMCWSAAAVEQLKQQLRENGGITVRTNFDPLECIWRDRPGIPDNVVERHAMEYAGESCASKLTRVRKQLRLMHVDGMLVSALDDIAWLLNLRGTDVHCNPVFVSYLLIASDKATLFVDGNKVSQDIKDYLEGEGVSVDEYDKVRRGLKEYGEYNILLNSNETNYALYNAASGCRIVDKPSPVPMMKAIKNEAEINGFRNAMVRDGVALTRFMMWLRPAVERGGQTEMSVSEKLTSLRAEQPLFRGESFDTIAGYESHGAIVHYEATEDTDAGLYPKGLLLMDSGAQYMDGTTDITRTMALGMLTDEQRRVYTLVLKGHLQLQNLKFPDGASGTRLDAVARMAIWREGMNFMHGTGHGVGAYLNVHEGPHQIRMEWRPASLKAGMTVTDEPGLYLAGRFGVRIENVLLVIPYRETEFGRFLQFEPLTLCPIDKTPIVKEMLSEEECLWLDDYHRHVFEVLSPYLEDNERAWLADACAPL